MRNRKSFAGDSRLPHPSVALRAGIENGTHYEHPPVADTVQLDDWDGICSTYPKVKVRMDFRYPESVGTFVYHCHLVDHEDARMMAKIKVNPANPGH